MGRAVRLSISVVLGGSFLSGFLPATSAVQARTSVVTVDAAGEVGGYTSLALDAGGNPVVSYIDDTNGDLKLAHCNDADCAGEDDSVVTVDSDGDVGWHTALALDAAGNPVIAYYEETAGELRVAHCNDANCAGGDDSVVTVDSDGDVGWSGSLALDGAGNPVISYNNYTTGDLKLAHCNDANCAGGDESIEIVDGGGAGWDTSLRLDAAGNPVISYFANNKDDLKLAHCNDANCAGGDESIVTLDSEGDVGWTTSLVLDAAGYPVVSYYDDTNGDLKLAHCNDADCAGEDDSVVAVDSDGDVGYAGSLGLDAAGNPVISYSADSEGLLKVAHCNDADCAGGDERVAILDGGGVGWFTSLVLDATGSATIAYNDYVNGDLKMARCGLAGCGDVTPPMPLIDLTPATTGRVNGWYVSRVTVAVTALDDDAVAGTRCVLNPSEAPTSFEDLPDTPCGPLTVNAFGRYDVYASAVDAAGNTSRVVHRSFKTIGGLRCEGSVPTRIGTTRRDVLVGTAGRDVILGLGGDDSIRSRGGNDIVCAGPGGDTVSGGGGRDHLFGQGGNDRLVGGLGADRLAGGAGNDVLDARLGHDQVFGGPGRDRILTAAR
jgi:hypothetical protein